MASVASVQTTPSPLDTYQLVVPKNDGALFVDAPLDNRTIVITPDSLGDAPGIGSRIRSYIKSCWPFCRKKATSEISDPLLQKEPSSEVIAEAVPERQITAVQPQASISCISKVKSVVKDRFERLKAFSEKHSEASLLAAFGCGTAALGFYLGLQSDPATAASLAGTGLCLMNWVRLHPKIRDAVNRALSFFSAEIRMGSNIIALTSKRAGIFLISPLVGALLLKYKEDIPDLDPKDEFPPEAMSTCKKVTYISTGALSVVAGGVLAAINNPSVLNYLLSLIPPAAAVVGFGALAFLSDLSTNLLVAPIVFHAVKMSAESKDQTGWRAVVSKITHLLFGSLKRRAYVATIGMGLYGILPGTLSSIGMALVAASLAADTYVSAKDFSEFKRQRKLELIDLETGKALPEMNTTAEPQQRPGCSPKVRIIAAVAFSIATITLGVLWQTQNWPWNESFQSSSFLFAATAGIWTDFVTNHRWNGNMHKQTVPSLLLKRSQFTIITLANYAGLNSGWKLAYGITNGCLGGWIYSLNRGAINSGDKDQLPSDAFVSTGILVKLIT